MNFENYVLKENYFKLKISKRSRSRFWSFYIWYVVILQYEFLFLLAKVSDIVEW